MIAKVQQPSRPSSASAQPTYYVVVDDQQPGTSRQMIFNPPSVAPSQQEKSQHNTSGLSSLFGAIPSVLQMEALNFNQHRHQCHLPLIMNSQDLPSSRASRVSPNQRISLHMSPKLALIKQLTSCMSMLKSRKSTPSNTYTSPQYKKLIV